MGSTDISSPRATPRPWPTAFSTHSAIPKGGERWGFVANSVSAISSHSEAQAASYYRFFAELIGGAATPHLAAG